MLEVGDICPDWNFVGPLNENINISMPPIAGRLSILIVSHSQNSVLESVFLKISDSKSLKDIIEYPDSYPGDEPMRRCPDIKKAKLQLNYTPKVELEDGINRFLNWAKDNYSNKI